MRGAHGTTGELALTAPTATIQWWQWPTVLSLDAPVVVVAWQAVLAQISGVELGWPHQFVLAASVWLAYAADRWIEGWHLTPSTIRTERHAFYQHWRWPVAALWSVVLAADVTVAFDRLSRHEIEAGVLLLP